MWFEIGPPMKRLFCSVVDFVEPEYEKGLKWVKTDGSHRIERTVSIEKDWFTKSHSLEIFFHIFTICH